MCFCHGWRSQLAPHAWMLEALNPHCARCLAAASMWACCGAPDIWVASASRRVPWAALGGATPHAARAPQVAPEGPAQQATHRSIGQLHAAPAGAGSLAARPTGTRPLDLEGGVLEIYWRRGERFAVATSDMQELRASFAVRTSVSVDCGARLRLGSAHLGVAVCVDRGLARSPLRSRVRAPPGADAVLPARAAASSERRACARARGVGRLAVGPVRVVVIYTK